MNERLLEYFLAQKGYTPEEIDDIKLNAQDYIHTQAKETNGEEK